MSGTSLDGLDCGLFRIFLNSKYEFRWSLMDFITYKYSDNIRSLIFDFISKNNQNRNFINNKLGDLYAELSEKFINGRNIDLISSHGQTIFHVDGCSTLQLGNPIRMHKKLSIPIVSNVRQADINQGGNGAPLMPFLDWLIFKNHKKEIITLNIGGMSNISFIPSSQNRNEVIGFDTGPGMALIDESCRYFYNKIMDKDGVYAQNGKIIEEVLDFLLQNDFIYKLPPKSTGRHEFGFDLFNFIRKKFYYISANDIIRTLCAFTAKSIAINITNFINFSSLDKKIIISGGGVYHPILIEDIKTYCGVKKIFISNDFGIKSDLKESLLMAVLGVANIKGIPSNMPSVTGARQEVVLGDITN